MSTESMMASNHLIVCCPLFPLPSIFPSIRVFSRVFSVCIKWPKYWSFRFSISPSTEYSGLISFRIDWFDLLAVQGTLQHHILKHQFFDAQPSYGPTLTSVHDYWKNYSFDYMEINIYIYILHTHTHIYIKLRLSYIIYMIVCVCVCVCIYIYIVSIHTHTHIYTYMDLHISGYR